MALRILIVDDNSDAADTLATLVELWGHVPTVAYDGKAGLRAACESRPDCLILDIGMPGYDGYTLAALVRQQPGLEGAKLVAVSAYSHPDHERRATEAGFDYRLVKPADPAELRRLLDMIEHIMRLADQTERLAEQNVAIAERTEAAVQKTEELAGQTNELLQEVKEDLKEVKQNMEEIKEDIKEVKDRQEKFDEGEGWKNPSSAE